MMPPTRSSRQKARRASPTSINNLDLSLLESSQRVTRSKANRIAVDSSIKTTFFHRPNAPYPPLHSSRSGCSSPVEIWSRNHYIATVDAASASRNPSLGSNQSSPLSSAPTSPTASSPPSPTDSSPLSSTPTSPIWPTSPCWRNPLLSPYPTSPSSTLYPTSSTTSPSLSPTPTPTPPPQYFTPCTHPLCPLPHLHNSGPYLHHGLPPPSLNSRHLFGICNPPPAVWQALRNLRGENPRREDLWNVAGFVGVHGERWGDGWGLEGIRGRVEADWWPHVDYAGMGWRGMM